MACFLPRHPPRALAVLATSASPLAAAASTTHAADAALPTQMFAPPPIQALVTEIAARSEIQRNLEELCDGIGPRMTGTPGLQRAQAWAMQKLRAYGASNVHLEAYDLGRPWQRGPAYARLLNANGMRLNVLQKAWTGGTRGTIRGEVTLLNASTMDDFNAALPRLKGKVVLVAKAPREAPKQALHESGVAAVLQVSGKSDGLQDMWGGPGQRYDSKAGIITREHANLLERLIARGVTPRLALSLGGGFAAKPVKAHNVVADFPGSEPDGEMVILGAHLDTWDLSSGATDNGAGVATMLEVLRAVHAAGLQPKRTLRVVLFSGEEQGLLGSKAYVAAHASDLPRIQAVLVQDAGSGRIIAYPDMQVDAWFTSLAAALAPAKALGEIDVHYAPGHGSDQDSFFRRGIPAFAPLQDARDYRSHTQHSQVDTIEHIDYAGLQQAAQVTAILAWGLLNGERMPHAPAAGSRPPPAPQGQP